MMTASICTSSSYFEYNCQDQTIQLWQEMTPTLSFYLQLNLTNFMRANSHCHTVESNMKEAIPSADFFSNSRQWLAGWFVVSYDAGLYKCHCGVLNVLFFGQYVNPYYSVHTTFQRKKCHHFHCTYTNNFLILKSILLLTRVL